MSVPLMVPSLPSIYTSPLLFRVRPESGSLLAIVAADDSLNLNINMLSHRYVIAIPRIIGWYNAVSTNAHSQVGHVIQYVNLGAAQRSTVMIPVS